MCMFLQMCICVYVSVYTCMFVCVCLYVYVHVYLCVCICVCIVCGCVCLHVRLSLFGLSYSSWYRITQCYSLLFILFLAFLFPSYFLPNIVLPF